MKQGIIKALLIYVFGFGLAWLIYSIFGHPYIHAPGFHHFIIFFTLIVGIIWTIIAILNFYIKRKTQKLKSFIITNLIVIIGLISSFIYDMKDYNNVEFESKPPKNQIISETKGDTTNVFHNGNIVFIKVKDSILLNLMENITFEE